MKKAWVAFGYMAFVVAWTIRIGGVAEAATVSASPSTCVNSFATGFAWSNPTRARTANSSSSTVTLTPFFTPFGTQSDYLKCTNYGFAIPAGAIIDGITVNVTRMSSGNLTGDASVRLMKAGVLTGSDLWSATEYPGILTVGGHGGPTNLWGTTWTVADINAASFGVALGAGNNSFFNRMISVDYIQVVVDYSFPVVVSSINLASSNPTFPATSVSWTVTFSASVTGVDASDFALIQGGGVSGATITSVTGSGATWTVTANTGSGTSTGTLGLNLVDNDTIVSGSQPLAGAGAGNGNFTGQVYVYHPLTCVIDSFSGADNSPPNSANWNVQKVSGSFTPWIFGNRLRITDTSGNAATRVTNKNLFPFGNNIVIAEFDYWAYGGSGADGIAITFSDPDKPTTGANNPPTAGGFGGSLGYANRDTSGTCNVAGFTGGWIGVGIDEYGNYSNPSECRNGGPGARVNAVSIRGSGSGAANVANNYGYLTGTAALGANGVASGGAATAYRYRITLDSVTDLAKVMVKVDQDKTGAGYLPLFSYDLKPQITSGAQAALPPQLQFTFTGSTGGSTNHHEVDNLSICAAAIISPGPHHLEIQHGNGAGVTCTPSTLTIKACADALSPCTPYTAGVSGMLSATGAPTVNWGGGSGAFAIAPGNSTATKSVQVTTVGSTVFGATSTPIAASASTCNFGTPSCTFTAADSGFIVSAPNHAAETSSTLTIQAVKKADNSLACVPGMTGVKSVNLKCSYTNPSSGTLPVRVGGTALNSTSNAAVACDSNGQNVSLTFDATGVATPTLQYADVGNMLINASFTGAAGTIDAGLSMLGGGSFIAAPASFAFSSITSGLIKAGNSFGATVTARNSLNAATPNFGKESSPEGVTLTSNLVSMPGANNPAIANNDILGGDFTDGAATVSNLSWGEVGLITLTANLTSGNYLSSAQSATGTSGNVGRFIPDHFDTVVSGGMACPSGLTCPTLFDGFVYSGQPFTTSVTARNLGGTTTTNYSNSLGYSKDVTLTAWDALGSSTSMPVTPAGNAVAAIAFTDGVATATPSYTFATVPTTPTNIYIRASDGEASSLRLVDPTTTSVEGGIKIVSGRGVVQSAYGSELLRLPVGVVVQYWNGTRWVTSTTDATALVVGNVGLANCQKKLGAPAPVCKPAVVVGSVTLANGVGSIVLNAPGSDNNGSVDLTLNAAGWPTWLPSSTGRAAFGIYKSKFIYLREMY